MFADSLIDASPSRRRWTTLASFAVQGLALTFLLVLPILYTEGLPQVHLRELLLGPPPSAAPAPASPRPINSRGLSNMAGTELVEPPAIPAEVARINDAAAPPPMPYAGQPFGVAHSTGNPEINNLTRTFVAATPPPLAPSTPPVRISRMMEGNLVHRVEPRYPPLAVTAGIQGAVILQATISGSGSIESIRVLSGHPMLVPAAVDAVRQWKYRPYFLNDQPVEVETQVTVNFQLAR